MRARLVLSALLVLLTLPIGVHAQDAAPKEYRKLAPGVETTVPMKRGEDETVTAHPIVELVPGTPGLEWTPQEYEKTKTLFYRSKGVLFRRGIWQLQFTFKPLRLIRVDIPETNGKMKKELIWYMVYRVTNLGGHLTPVQGQAEQFNPGAFTVQSVDSDGEMLASIGPHRFMPTFFLRTHTSAELKPDPSSVEYMDEVIPAARREVYIREKPACKFSEFYDTAQMAADPVPLSTGRTQVSRFGVVTWRAVDPTVDYITIQIMGLTNAYKWIDPPGAFKPGNPPGTGRLFAFKTLQINFYRPGDEFDAREEEIQLGVKGHPEWKWLYRQNPLTYAPTRPRQ